MRIVIKWIVGLLVVAAVLAGASVGATRYFAPPKTEIATVAARKGEFVVDTHTHGMLRSVSSSMVTAPVLGGQLLATDITPAGTQVHKDEVVLTFDREDQQNALLGAQSRVDEAEQTIRRAQADAAIKEHQDTVDLMRARFAVRRAELEVSKNEMAAAIEAEKNNLALDAARKKLAQLTEDIAARKSSYQADLAVNQEKLNKAKLDRTLAENRMKQLDVKAPMDGLVSVRQNRMAAGGMMFPGMDLPDFRVGDQVGGGNPVIDIVDMNKLELSAQVEETDRGHLKEGQSVTVHLDSLPDLPLQGTVKQLGSINSRDWDAPTKTFEAVFSIDLSKNGNDPRLRPGLSGEVVIFTEKAANVVYVPQQAVIEKDGRKWVYVAQADAKFQRREVTTGRRSESQVEIVSGLTGVERVALADPEERASTAKKKSNPLSSSPGGK